MSTEPTHNGTTRRFAIFGLAAVAFAAVVGACVVEAVTGPASPALYTLAGAAVGGLAGVLSPRS